MMAIRYLSGKRMRFLLEVLVSLPGAMNVLLKSWVLNALYLIIKNTIISPLVTNKTCWGSFRKGGIEMKYKEFLEYLELTWTVTVLL